MTCNLLEVLAAVDCFTLQTQQTLSQLLIDQSCVRWTSSESKVVPLKMMVPWLYDDLQLMTFKIALQIGSNERNNLKCVLAF